MAVFLFDIIFENAKLKILKSYTKLTIFINNLIKNIVIYSILIM